MRVPHGNSRLARALRSLFWLLNINSVSLCAVGCLAVYLCERLNLSFALDISLIVFGVTFAVRTLLPLKLQFAIAKIVHHHMADDSSLLQPCKMVLDGGAAGKAARYCTSRDTGILRC